MRDRPPLSEICLEALPHLKMEDREIWQKNWGSVVLGKGNIAILTTND
jgi:hypothetical protein